MARIVATRQDYFSAALDMLASDGHGALRIGGLCRRLGVTTGSFYHYFGSFRGFVDELLAYWEQEKTRRVFELALAVPDAERVRTIKELALALPHEAETAIRGWAHVNPAVAAVQQRVDGERAAAVRAVLSAVVPSTAEAELLASMAMSILIGYQQWRSPVDRAELGRALDMFDRLVSQRAAPAAH